MESTRRNASFAQWEESHAMLLAMEKLLAEAVAQFARGEAPFPDGLYSEVAALRRRADTLFDAAVNAAGREG